MRITALVPDSAVREIERALGAEHELARPSSAAAAARSVFQRECSALVLDPGLLSDAELTELVPTLRQKTVPVLLFSELRAASARRIVEAEALGAHELVLRGQDDTVELLALRLGARIRPSAPALLLSHAARSLHGLPAPLQAATVGLYGSGPPPRWVSGLVEACGIPRRSVDRWIERAGIHGSAMLLDTARLAHVWEPLVERRTAATEVAEHFGYSCVRRLVTHARRIVGVAPVDFAAELTRETFAQRLARRLLTR